MQKKLSLWQSTFMGVAGNAPAYGIGVATATLLASALTIGPLAVFVCGIAMFGILIAYQKLNEVHTDCGAAYAWVGRILNPVLGFLAGWSLLVALTAFMVSAMLAAGEAVVAVVGFDATANKTAVYVIALGCLAIVSAPALLGARVFGPFQSLLTAIELSIVTFVACLLAAKHGEAAFQSFLNLTPGRLHIDFGSFAKGVAVAVFFFWGWDVIFNLSEETEDSKQTSARAGLFTLGVLIILYVAFSLFAVALFGPGKEKATDSNLLMAMARDVLAAPYDKVVVIAFLISVIGSLDASIIQFSRTLLSGARDGSFPKALRWTSRGGVPTWAVLLVIVLAALLTVTSYVSGTVIDSITAGVAGSAIFVAFYYGLAGVACGRFFYRTERRPGGLMLYVVWPVAASLILMACAAATALEFGAQTSVVVVVALASGLLIAFLKARSKTRVAQQG